MKKLISTLTIIAAVCALMLCCSSCGGGKDETEITVYNWGEYIDLSVLDEFKEQTGITVNYQTFDKNEALYSLMKTGAYDIDVIICSDYMISRFISENMLAKLNFENISNFSLVDDSYKNLSYDTANEYTVPYMWGTVGLIYNSKMIDEEITSWGALFDEKYANNILMIDNSRDAVAIALLYLGYSVNTTNEAEIREAYDLLKTQKPIVQSYVMDQIFDKLEGGEAAIGTYYAGDYLTMLENNPDLKFVIPEEGSTWFVDAMCVPKTSTKQEAAEKFINFMTSTEIAEKNMDQTCYTSPNAEACEEYFADFDEESYKVMNPDSKLLSTFEMFLNLPENILKLYDSLWNELKA